jgi:hypothetical protein
MEFSRLKPFPASAFWLLALTTSFHSSPKFNPDYYPVMDWESDVESINMAFDNMDISSGSSATSYDADSSIRSASPASVISINSNMQFFKYAHGRMVNNYSDVYKFPADEEEFDRLSTLGVNLYKRSLAHLNR